MRQSIRIVAYATLSSAAFAAMPAYAGITTADRLGTALLVAPAAASPSAGSSVAGARGVRERIAPGAGIDRVVVIHPKNAADSLNVDYGDPVQFVVRQPDAAERVVAWRFDGLVNTITYGDIDPQPDFARNLTIYVNQASNPMRAGGF